MAAAARTIGWLLDAADRDRLIARFPPRWPDAIAHHVTLAFASDAPLPHAPATAAVVGHADDGAGVEALVVAIDGSTARPDGSRYHITWSIDRARGRRPRESNDVLAAHGWTPIAPPIPIRLIPGLID